MLIIAEWCDGRYSLTGKEYFNKMCSKSPPTRWQMFKITCSGEPGELERIVERFDGEYLKELLDTNVTTFIHN
jgi:hypothetical protein